MGPEGLTSALAALAGGLAVVAAAEAFRAAPTLGAAAASAIEPMRRASREGYSPTERERRRLGLLAGTLLLGLAVYLAGPGPLAAAAAAGPALAGWLLGRRRRAYRRAFDRALPEVGGALADSISAGRSARAAVGEAAGVLAGPASAELARVRSDLELGASLEAALGRLRRGIHSPRVDALVAALLAERIAGGEVAGLLRRFSAACAERDRAAAEARTETAQARFTGLLVAAMPVGAALFAELAGPGVLATVLGDPLARAMLVLAAILQLLGFLAIAGLAKVRR